MQAVTIGQVESTHRAPSNALQHICKQFLCLKNNEKENYNGHNIYVALSVFAELAERITSLVYYDVNQLLINTRQLNIISRHFKAELVSNYHILYGMMLHQLFA